MTLSYKKIASPCQVRFNQGQKSLMLRTVVAFVLLFAAGCSTTSQPQPISQSPTAAVIFVPGFKGSVLSQADGSTAWVTGVQALFDGDTLALESAHELGLPHGAPLQPTAVLKSIDLLFGLISYDIYGRWLRYLRGELPAHIELVELAYDWRKGALEGSRALSAQIKSLRARGIKDISVVAHSMGGLATSYYLRFGDQAPQTPVENWEGAKLVNRAVLIATPFRGAMTMFRDMLQGAPTFWNDSLLSPDVLAGFPSSYDLLPTGTEDVLLTKDGGEVVGLVRQADQWAHYGWGILTPSAHAASSERELRRAAVKRRLEESELFHTALLSPPWLTDQQQLALGLLVITGKGQPTLSSGELDEESGVINFRDNPRFFRDGDGTVTTTSLRLPAGFHALRSVTEIQTDTDHVSAMEKPHIRAKIVQFILGQEQR